MTNNIIELKQTIAMIPQMELLGQLEILMNLHSRLTPYKEQYGVKEVYKHNIEKIENITKEYITLYNQCPRVRLGR